MHRGRPPVWGSRSAYRKITQTSYTFIKVLIIYSFQKRQISPAGIPEPGELERITEMTDKRKILWKVFLSTLYLSAFTFGGGYVIVTLMKRKFVDEYHWIEEDEMLDLTAIAQSAPGAVAVNGAIVVGYKLAGLAGALTAIIGTVIPPFVIISVISAFYTAFRDNFIVSQVLEGMQAGVGAVIAVVVYEMGSGIVHGRSPASIGIMAGAFAAACLGVNVVCIILVCIVIGVVRTLYRERGKTN